MRYFYSATVLATICLAACWPSHVAQASELSKELIERLKPVAFWKFNEDTGRVVLEETERCVGLSQGGVRYASRSARDSALSLDGHSGCVVVRHRHEFLLEQGSIACWVRAGDVTRAQGILSKDANGFGGGGHLTISIDQGQIAVRLQSVTDSYEVRAEACQDRWTHVAFTFGSEGMQLYIDGQLADSAAYEGGLGASSGGSGNHEPLVFGASTMTSQATSELPLTSFLKGELDEVAIFARQLAPGEIAELASPAVPRYESLMRAYVANRPKAWWRLDEPEGETLAIDQLGSQDGSYNVVGASRFDGDDFVDLGSFDLDGTFTILAHVTPQSFAVSDARIIAKENGLNEEDQFWSLSTTIQDDRARLRFRLRTDNGTREAVSTGRNLDVHRRVFVAAVYDGKRMRLYQDGELVGEVAQHGRPKTNAHCHVWIADSPSGAGKRPFDGAIDDVAILEDAISQDQIRAIFDASRERPAPAPHAEPTRPAPAVETPELPPPAIQPAAPFVHRCPLCDIEYRDIPIHRVPLPATLYPPICETPFNK